MTCIVGIATGDQVLIGADSAGTGGWDQRIRSDLKVFTNGPMVFGFTTSFRMGQLLRYKLNIPTRSADIPDDLGYMCGPFIDAVRQALKEGGFATTKDGGEVGGTFLVGYKAALYCIQSDYQVEMTAEPYNAVGCGHAYALGSLHGSAKLKPIERITAALEAAAHFSAGVGGPFTVVTGGKSNPNP